MKPTQMNKEHLTKFRLKKEAYKGWEKVQVIQEKYTDIVQVSRNGVRKAKVPWS